MWDSEPVALRASPGVTSPLATQVKLETAPGVRVVACEMCTCRAHACHAGVGRQGRRSWTVHADRCVSLRRLVLKY